MRSVGTDAWIFEKQSVTLKYYREITITKYTELVRFCSSMTVLHGVSYLGENRGEKSR
jgi:hypothetical protein